VIFFVLSGYLITRQLSTQVMTWQRFMWRRFTRLWPALAFLCVVLGILSLTAGRSVIPIAASVLWVASPANLLLPGWDDVFVGHTWSLAVEAQFYAVWGFVMLWANRGARGTIVWWGLVFL
jgi:peptidoglycan/LPS O-acetylase OafA/YrhL